MSLKLATLGLHLRYLDQNLAFSAQLMNVSPCLAFLRLSTNYTNTVKNQHVNF